MKGRRYIIPILLSALFLAILIILPGLSKAQYTRQLFISEDEDFINIRGDGTDKGYSSGLHIGILFGKEKNRFFLHRWMPNADSSAVNIYSVELNHVIFTPEDLQSTILSENDYPYAGALYLNHAKHSFSSDKSLALHSEIIAGVMGPWSLAGEIQTTVHKMIGDERPQGWARQLPNDLLLNFDLAVEKRMLHWSKWFDGIPGVQLSLGSLRDAVETYGLFRLGKMNDYFDGSIAQRATPRGKPGRWQLYAFARPGAQLVAYNALLEGGLILSDFTETKANIRHLLTSFDYGLVLSFKNVGLSFTQKAFSGPVKKLGSQETGNISLSFSW